MDNLDGQSLLPEDAVRWYVVARFGMQSSNFKHLNKQYWNWSSNLWLIQSDCEIYNYKKSKEEVEDSAERANWLLVSFIYERSVNKT